MPSCAVFTRALDWPIKTPSVPIDRVLKAPRSDEPVIPTGTYRVTNRRYSYNYNSTLVRDRDNP